jgi:hypothetical protein
MLSTALFVIMLKTVVVMAIFYFIVVRKCSLCCTGEVGYVYVCSLIIFKITIQIEVLHKYIKILATFQVHFIGSYFHIKKRLFFVSMHLVK